MQYTTVNFIEFSYSLLSFLEGNKLKPYPDSIGIPTISIGVRVDTNLSIVLANMGIAANDPFRAAFQNVANTRYTTRAATQAAFDNVMHQRAASLHIPYHDFSLTDAQSHTVFVQTFTEQEQKVNRLYAGVPDSKEKAVLLSLVYNGVTGPSLSRDISEGKRAEAWFEIRYRSNGTPGVDLSNRRYVESQYFGLYDEGRVDRAESLEVYQMVSKPGRLTQMKNYDAAHYAGVNGWKRASDPHVDSLEEALTKAHDFLVDRYSGGLTIPWTNIYVSASNNSGAVNVTPAADGSYLIIANGQAGESLTALAGRSNVLAATHSGVTFNAGDGEAFMVVDSGGFGTFNTASGDAIIIGGSGADRINVKDAAGKVIVVYGQGGADQIDFTGSANNLVLQSVTVTNPSVTNLRSLDLGQYRQSGKTVIVEINSTSLNYTTNINGIALGGSASVELLDQQSGRYVQASGNPVDTLFISDGTSKVYGYRSGTGVVYTGYIDEDDRDGNKHLPVAITKDDMFAWLPSGEFVELKGFSNGAFGVKLEGDGFSSENHALTLSSGHSNDPQGWQVVDTKGDKLSFDGMNDAAKPITLADYDGGGQGSARIFSQNVIANDGGLYGDEDPNLLDPGGQYSYVEGGGGGDTVVFNRGYGFVRINEVDSGASPANELAFGAGTVAADVTVTANDLGDLILTLEGDDDIIVVEGGLNSTAGAARGVQSVRFADGTVWSYATLLAKVATASASSAVIFGDKSANTLDTAGLASYAVGGGGGDTFFYDVGYGVVSINEADGALAPLNRLELGVSILPSAVSVSGDDNGDLILSIGTDGDFVVIKGGLRSDGITTYGVQAIDFADGTIWTYADLLAQSIAPAVGKGVIVGDRSANTLDTQGLVERVSGGGGGDTITFGLGYGPLTIHEVDEALVADNTLAFASGIVAADVTVTATEAGDLVLTIAGGADQVVIEGALTSSASAVNGVQRVTFADGTIWTYADLLAQMSAAGPTSELQGDASANVFDTGGLSSRIVGRGGGDTIVFEAGYGALVIDELETGGATNVLAFGAGVAASSVNVAGDEAGNLILSLGSGADQVVLAGALTGQDRGVQRVTFADGSHWTYDDLLARALVASSDRDAIYGDTNANEIDSLGLSHAVVGGGGADVFVYQAGYGALAVRETDASGRQATLAFGEGIDPGDITLSTTSGGDLILQLSGGDQVTIEGALSPTQGVKQVTFSNGQSWTFDEMLAFASGEQSFELGDGVLRIDQAKAPASSASVVHIGSGLTAADLRITVGGEGHTDLVVQVGAFDQIILQGALASTGTAGLAFVFDDDSSLSFADLLASLGQGSAGGVGVFGGAGADTLDSLGQVGFASGGGGGDTFVYEIGYGALVVDELETGAAINTLALGDGIVAGDVKVTANAQGDILLSLSDGDQVLLSGALNGQAGAARGVQRVTFADGSSWSRSDLLAQVTTGSEGVSTLYGDGTANLFDSLGLSENAIGHGGGDTFVFERGYGLLSIVEEDTGAAPSNVLAFGVGIDPASIIVNGSGQDLMLEILNPDGDSDYVLLTNALRSQSGTSYGVQLVTFADGTSWTYADLLSRALDPNLNYTITGDGSANVLDAMGMAHSVVGNGGGDTIVYGLDYGGLEIDERDSAAQPANVLNFKSDIAPADVLVSGDGGGALVLTIAGGYQITLTNQLRSAPGEAFGVQSVNFSDGTSWTYDDLVAMAGTASAEKWGVFGDRSANTLDVAGLTSDAFGEGGGDTFIYDAGYGAVTIHEVDLGASPQNVLQFGAGVAAADVLVTANDDGDLVLKVGDGDDIVTLSGAAISEEPGAHGVQRVTFVDGTEWSRAQLLVFAATPVSGQAAIYGTAAAEALDTQGLVSRVSGGGGGDTIAFNLGYGAMTIDERDHAVGTDNRLVFGAGIEVGDLRVSLDGDDIILKLDGTSDQVTISNGMTDAPWISLRYGVQSVSFADGAILTKADLVNLAAVGSTDNTELRGDSGANVLDPNGYASSVRGGGGGDTIIFHQGYGQVVIEEFEEQGAINHLDLGPGITAAGVQAHVNDDNDIVLFLGGLDEVTLVSAMDDPRTTGVQEVRFSDGTVWSTADLVARAHTGSVDNTELYGWFDADIFNPNGFAHYVEGRGAGDTVNYDLGDGDLEINEYEMIPDSENILALGAGITSADVDVWSDVDTHVHLTLSNGDDIQLDYMITGGGYGVQKVTFTDGAVWTAADVAQKALTGSSGHTELYGGSQGDIIDSAGFATFVSGRGGGDTFKYNLGYGALEVSEIDGNLDAPNVLVFGAGISSDDVVVSDDLNGSVILTLGGNDQITLDGQLLGNPAVGVQEVRFADGTVWTAQDLVERASGVEGEGSSFDSVTAAQRLSQSLASFGTDDFASWSSEEAPIWRSAHRTEPLLLAVAG